MSQAIICQVRTASGWRNLLLVQDAELASSSKPFLRFETLSLAPFDRRLIDPSSMLDGWELAWLNAYQLGMVVVLSEVGPHLDAAARDWLANASRLRNLGRRTDMTHRDGSPQAQALGHPTAGSARAAQLLDLGPRWRRVARIPVVVWLRTCRRCEVVPPIACRGVAG